MLPAEKASIVNGTKIACDLTEEQKNRKEIRNLQMNVAIFCTILTGFVLFLWAPWA